MPQREPSGFPAGLAVLTSLFAVGLGVAAIGVAATNDGGGGSGGAAPGVAVSVDLADFSISPTPIEAVSGGSLALTNVGNTVHNLAVRDQSVQSADLQSGDSQELPLTGLAEGSYAVYCTIGGHAEAGMEGTLVVTGGDSSEVASGDTTDHTTDHGADGSEEDWARLDQAMHDTILEFPAESEGVGNQPLEPTEVTDDGTLVFDLTVAITDWEVEPGNAVQAYSYNGQVPGPWIKINTGDQVQIRVTNDLPMGTDIHFHGIDIPNEMDGVAPITQEMIEPNGGTFTYEFTAERQALGMYHAHHHGQLQVPNGLFGMFQIDDMPLPLGQTVSGVTIPEDLELAQEIPMVLNDAGVIGLSLNGKGFPATAPYVMQEDEWALVHYQSEGLQVHPMHLHGFRQLVIAKDGVPLDQPYWADTINVAPGERYSVLFQADRLGTWVWHCHILNHVERAEGMFGMVTAVVVQGPEAEAAPPATDPTAGA